MGVEHGGIPCIKVLIVGEQHIAPTKFRWQSIAVPNGLQPAYTHVFWSSKLPFHRPNIVLRPVGLFLFHLFYRFNAWRWIGSGGSSGNRLQRQLTWCWLSTWLLSWWQSGWRRSWWQSLIWKQSFQSFKLPFGEAGGHMTVRIAMYGMGHGDGRWGLMKGSPEVRGLSTSGGGARG